MGFERSIPGKITRFGLLAVSVAMITMHSAGAQAPPELRPATVVASPSTPAAVATNPLDPLEPAEIQRGGRDRSQREKACGSASGS